MKKKKIVKKNLAFLKQEGFKLQHKKYAKHLNLYLFYKANNPAIKIIITENIFDKFVDLKIRGSNHQILFFYEWNQLMTNSQFECVNELINEANLVYKDLKDREYTKIYIQSLLEKTLN